jgi:hypothetical protein
MELASFLAMRGHCLLDLRNHREAVEAYLWGSALHPENKLAAFWTRNALECWRKSIKKLLPPNFPEFNIRYPTKRIFPETLPLAIERHMITFGAYQDLLDNPIHNDNWWDALRRGGIPKKRIPSRIEMEIQIY